jgi:hypothetical protein
LQPTVSVDNPAQSLRRGTLVAPGLHGVLRFAAFCKVACANFSTFLVLSAF